MSKTVNPLNNKGFSLIELIVSIAVLALVIVPILNNFVASANVNAEAKRAQEQNTLVQQLMEETKSSSLHEIARQFNYPEDGTLSYELKPDGAGGYLPVQEGERSCVRTAITGPTGNLYEYRFIARTDRPYYFARKNLDYNGVCYDALITIDGSAYRGTDPAGNPTGYNTVRMPLLNEVDRSGNVVAQESYEAELSAASLFRNHFTYCLAEEELHSGEPGFAITYHSLEEIKNRIIKKYSIQINQSGSELTTMVWVDYSCPTYEGCGSVSYQIASGNLTVTDGQIYVFYTPSYQDEFVITKAPVITEEIDLYLYRQNPVPAAAQPEAISIPVGINLYSNVVFPVLPVSPIKMDAVRDRLYDIKVQLFKAGTDFRSDALCIGLESAREE
jgi:prepilin-type N-terminal cleavage/methylation domain-containing protein